MIRPVHQLLHQLLTSCFTVCLLCACSENDAPDPAPTQSQHRIGFGIAIGPTENQAEPQPDNQIQSQSRAAITEKDDMVAFRIYGAQYEGTDQWNSPFSFYPINGDIARPAKNGDWTTAIPYYWPDKNRLMRFFAYSPVEIEGWVHTNPEKAPEDARFFYTVPSDPAKQIDLLCSSLTQRINHSANPETRVQLWFHHALTQVRFDIRGNDPSTVESITLSGLTGCGGYHPTPGDGWWDLYNYEQTDEGFRTAYTVRFPADGTVGDNQRLMVIPQTTPYGSKIELRFRDGRYESRDFSYKTFNLGAVANIVLWI